MRIEIDHLWFSYTGAWVLSNVQLTIAPGQRWAIIGKNGAGKSSLVRCIAGLERPAKGAIRIEGKPLNHFAPRELARLLAYVPQAQGRMLPYPVAEYVMMGRFPYQGLFANPSSHDHDVVTDALRLTDSISLKDRAMNTLSGGELQRVFLAGAVSQRTGILVLDEPATFLDPLHQAQLQAALARIHDEFHATIITVTHDINAALSWYDNVLALVDGSVFYAGPAAEMLNRSPAILEKIFGIPFDRGVLDKTGRPFVAPVFLE